MSILPLPPRRYHFGDENTSGSRHSAKSFDARLTITFPPAARSTPSNSGDSIAARQVQCPTPRPRLLALAYQLRLISAALALTSASKLRGEYGRHITEFQISGNVQAHDTTFVCGLLKENSGPRVHTPDKPSQSLEDLRSRMDYLIRVRPRYLLARLRYPVPLSGHQRVHWIRRPWWWCARRRAPAVEMYDEEKRLRRGMSGGGDVEAEARGEQRGGASPESRMCDRCAPRRSTMASPRAPLAGRVFTVPWEAVWRSHGEQYETRSRRSVGRCTHLPARDPGGICAVVGREAEVACAGDVVIACWPAVLVVGMKSGGEELGRRKKGRYGVQLLSQPGSRYGR
ncbi:hypothetical protein K438DRAFT_1786857 [Mycena galopus ATCC 62051]|nr:hypothetical protein K438DRAFT_1786857 [Mycena galopus ATCC 62051]